MKKSSVFPRLCLLLCLVFLLLTMSSCYAVGMLFYGVYGPIKYEGPYIDMYTVAVNNILSVRGHENNGEVSWEAQVTVLEEDSYGRVLFLYDEHHDGYCGYCETSYDCYGMAYCIMQKSDGEFAWFYQDACYLATYDGEEEPVMDQLKLRNDWNQPLNLQKCTKAPYIEQRPESSRQVPEEVFEKAMRTYLRSQGFRVYDGSSVLWFDYCNTDMVGHELYFVSCRVPVSGTPGVAYKDYAVIVRADGTIEQSGIRQIVRATAQDVVQELKKQNNWVYPQ